MGLQGGAEDTFMGQGKPSWGDGALKGSRLGVGPSHALRSPQATSLPHPGQSASVAPTHPHCACLSHVAVA